MRRGRPAKAAARRKTTGRGGSSRRSEVRKGLAVSPLWRNRATERRVRKDQYRIRSVFRTRATPILSGKWPNGPAQSTIWVGTVPVEGRDGVTTNPGKKGHPRFADSTLLLDITTVPNTKPRVPAATRVHLLIQRISRTVERRPDQPSRLHDGGGSSIATKDDRCQIQREPALLAQSPFLFFYAQRESPRFADCNSRCGSASVVRLPLPAARLHGLRAVGYRHGDLYFTPFRPARSGGTFLSTI